MKRDLTYLATQMRSWLALLFHIFALRASGSAESAGGRRRRRVGACCGGERARGCVPGCARAPQRVPCSCGEPVGPRPAEGQGNRGQDGDGAVDAGHLACACAAFARCAEDRRRRRRRSGRSARCKRGYGPEGGHAAGRAVGVCGRGGRGGWSLAVTRCRYGCAGEGEGEGHCWWKAKCASSPVCCLNECRVLTTFVGPTDAHRNAPRRVLPMEAILSTKEPSEDTCGAVFALLVTMGRKMKEIGVINMSLLEGAAANSGAQHRGRRTCRSLWAWSWPPLLRRRIIRSVRE